MIELPLSATLLICDRLIEEKDDVFTLVRLIDYFRVSVKPDFPIEQQVVKLRAFINLKTTPEDNSQHTILLRVIRPDGATGVAVPETPVELKTKVPATPLGINLGVQLDVVPRIMGTHYLVLVVDGKDAAWAQFTLQSRQDPSEKK